GRRRGHQGRRAEGRRLPEGWRREGRRWRREGRWWRRPRRRPAEEGRRQEERRWRTTPRAVTGLGERGREPPVLARRTALIRTTGGSRPPLAPPESKMPAIVRII